jgi:hypothetical protein
MVIVLTVNDDDDDDGVGDPVAAVGISAAWMKTILVVVFDVPQCGR